MGREGRGRLRPLALDVDHEPWRVVEIEDLVLPHLLEVEHHADDVVTVLGDADLLEEPVADREDPAGEVGVEPGAHEVDPEPIGVRSAVRLELDPALQVDHDPGRGIAAPRAQVEDPGEAPRRRGGEGSRRLALPEESLRSRGVLPLRVGVEVGPCGVGHPAALPGPAGDLDGGPKGVVAQAARGVLADERPVREERVLAVAGRAETRGHLAVEVAGGEEGVVTVPAPRVACDDLPVAEDDRLPLGALRHAGAGGAETALGGLGLPVEGGVGTRGGRGRPPGRRASGQAGGEAEKNPQGGEGRRPVPDEGAHLGQLSTVS
jgi:hypothetical protein